MEFYSDQRIVFRLSRIYDNFLFRLSCSSTSNRIRIVHVNAAVYRSHRSHGNVKIYTVAQIHTSVLSREGLSVYVTPCSTSMSYAERDESDKSRNYRFIKTDYPIYSTSCLPTYSNNSNTLIIILFLIRIAFLLNVYSV